jgi:hypothetical protein
LKATSFVNGANKKPGNQIDFQTLQIQVIPDAVAFGGEKIRLHAAAV